MAFNSYGKKNGFGFEAIEEIIAAIRGENPPIHEKLETLRKDEGYKVELDQIKKKHCDKDLGRRSAPRYALKLEVVLMTSKKSFKSATENISEVGALLKDVLPIEFVDRVFEILIIFQEGNKKEYFLFHGRTAGGALLSPRLRFVKSMGNSSQRLNQLIETLSPAVV